jgi:hypothetical protein
LATTSKLENDAQNWTTESRLRLARRRTGKPATKAGQIRALWPEIAAALENGQSVKSIRKWLEEDAGIVVGITSLTSYISRIRRREPKCPRLAARSIPGAVHEPDSRAEGGHRNAPTQISDPIAQAMQALTKPQLDIRKLHSDGDPTGKNLI